MDHRQHGKKRILFILKKREVAGYGTWAEPGRILSSGLHNSVMFMVNMLQAMRVEVKAVTVNDNNDIDREVKAYKPTHVIVEAFWVVVEKFDVLKPLHPNVKWIVRDHSKTEFLANEGIAFGWTIGYLQRGVKVACNSPEAQSDMQVVAKQLGLGKYMVPYLPNYYPYTLDTNYEHRDNEGKMTVNVGCFGAIRPLKNHLVQIIAALRFADRHDLRLRLHINATRVEGKADPVLKNIRQLFEGLPKHKLVEHPWMEHAEFLKVIKTMDISLQVSFSETFNIVTADAVSQNVPVVGSNEIPWLPYCSVANPNDSEDIARVMTRIWTESKWVSRLRQCRQRRGLVQYNEATMREWSRNLL